MPDVKSDYSTTASRIKKSSESNKALDKKLKGGKKRTEKYGANWESVSLNDLVNKVAPGATSYESGGKIIFSNGGRYIIVTDVAGGYCRIQDLNDRSSNPYVTQDFKSYNDLPVDDRQRLTHYRIKKRGEK